MKNSIYILLLLSIFVIGCEKTVTPQPQPLEEPKKSDNWAEWNIPAKLPDSFKEDLLNTPCWYGASWRMAKIEDNKVVIKSRADLEIGGGQNIMVFDKQGWDSFLGEFLANNSYPPYYHRVDADILRNSHDYFVGYYPDSMLVFTTDKLSKLKEGDKLDILLLAPKTKEFFEEKILIHMNNDDSKESE